MAVKTFKNIIIEYLSSTAGGKRALAHKELIETHKKALVGLGYTESEYSAQFEPHDSNATGVTEGMAWQAGFQDKYYGQPRRRSVPIQIPPLLRKAWRAEYDDGYWSSVDKD